MFAFIHFCIIMLLINVLYEVLNWCGHKYRDIMLWLITETIKNEEKIRQQKLKKENERR